MNKAKKTSGFTLIELIVVMVILGILAAFIIPRFAKLDKEARIAVVEGVGGSVRAAAALAHSLSLARGVAHNVAVDMEGVAVTMTQYYPTANTAGIIAALGGLVQGFNTTTSQDGNIITLLKQGAVTPASCSISYTAAEANGAPNIVVVTTGC